MKEAGRERDEKGEKRSKREKQNTLQELINTIKSFFTYRSFIGIQLVVILTDMVPLISNAGGQSHHEVH